jgi:DNA-binding NtrC family response regulator
LNNDYIFTIHEDKAGIFWIGTWGGGLNRFDREKETFVNYTIKDGLPSNQIYGILEDEKGNLWISTNNGLSKFDLAKGTFKNFTVEDGLQSREFNGGSYLKSRRGEMFFGGIRGFNAFFPENIKDNPHIPPIVITGFFKLNKEVKLEKPISRVAELNLSYKDYVFSFEFAALDYTAPVKNGYAYKMEALDEEWIYTDSRKRFATYTTLAPGSYLFKVKGSNNDGLWNEEGTSIQIIIHPPFWKTWWFRSLVILAILLAAFAWYRSRIRKIETRRKELEIRVNEKTEAAEALRNALDEVERLKNRLQAENIYLQDEIKLTNNFENIVTRSEALKKVLYNVEEVAATDATVLILGESGTGKELVARAIHNISDRGDRPLVKVNCASLPSNLIESELFGHEKGAFTGAISKKIGRFELADGGTIFLDEIGDLPLELQSKLLRVLQEGEFERLGSVQTIKVDVRVIAATNRALEKEMANGSFREDLYYRLNVFPVILPPLRERKEDIPLLVNHFVKKYSTRVGKKIEIITQPVLDTLEQYHWPGNVRELENIIERAVIISQGKKLLLGDWLSQTDTPSDTPHIYPLEEMERRYILEVLEITNWRVSGEKGAAKILGINSKTLDSKMKKLNIERKK